MSAYIQNIVTEVPKGNFEQSYLREKMKDYVSQRPATRRIIHRIYANSAIEKRHTVVNDFHSNGHPRLFFQDDGILSEPTTKKRNDLYTKHAKDLFTSIARHLLNDNPAIKKSDITHVITVSCTGFFAPGPAYEIVKQLDLPHSTQRFHIGFMGCFGVFPALKMAQSFCEANPDAKVMILSTELCTLHFQNSDETDQLISASVFADGAAGALISADNPVENRPVLRIEQFQTSIADGSEQDMTWSIGDTGFDMVLSTYVPEIIKANLRDAVSPLLQNYSLDFDDIDDWPVHPGGRAILDKIEHSLELQPSQLQPSRSVLNKYGNMSSATILFVLDELMRISPKNEERRAMAVAFGPGLTIESALLTMQT